MRRQGVQNGFTIVELLIVVVVIGILAAIVLVSYFGIQDRARGALIESDLNSAAKQLEAYRITTSTNESYPQANDCSTSPVASSICLKHSAETVLEYSSLSGGASFCLSAVLGGIGKSTSPGGSILNHVCTGHSAPSNGGGPAPAGWTDIAAGETHTCGIYNSKLYCWGTGGNGELGNGVFANQPTKQEVVTSGALAGKTPTSVVAHAYGTCAVADGGGYCWGLGTTRRLGDGTTANSAVPVLATGALAGKTVTAIATHYSNTCATADGRPYCWGAGANGRNGDNSTTNRTTPVAVYYSGVLSGLTTAAIASGSSSNSSQGHTCTMTTLKVYCWGYGTSGQLGNSASISSQIPVEVSGTGVLSGKTPTAISAGGTFTCVVASAAPYCWGRGLSGELGNSASSSSSVPVAVTTSGVLAGKTVTQISSGNEHTCVVASGAVYCWGVGDNGRLGHGTSPSVQNSPVAVSMSGALAGKTVTKVSAGGLHTCAITSDGGLYCWGWNPVGQLGDGGTISSDVPVLATNP